MPLRMSTGGQIQTQHDRMTRRRHSCPTLEYTVFYSTKEKALSPRKTATTAKKNQDRRQRKSETYGEEVRSLFFRTNAHRTAMTIDYLSGISFHGSHCYVDPVDTWRIYRCEGFTAAPVGVTLCIAPRTHRRSARLSGRVCSMLWLVSLYRAG